MIIKLYYKNNRTKKFNFFWDQILFFVILFNTKSTLYGVWMKIAIVVNNQAAQTNLYTYESMMKICQNFNMDAEIIFCSADKIEINLYEVLRRNPKVIIIGGGDGSIRTAVQVIYKLDIPLAILPLGTFNHFAKALQLPNQLEQILQLIVDMKIKKVDVGSVNDYVFVNNSTIGFYSKLVKEKEKQNFFMNNRFFKALFYVKNIFKILPVYSIKFKINEFTKYYQSNLIFIGNNYYCIDIKKFGERNNLSSGHLSIYIAEFVNQWGLFKLFFHILFKNKSVSDYLDLYVVKEAIIDCKSKKVNLTLDGELFKMEAPLIYKSIPGGLCIISD